MGLLILLPWIPVFNCLLPFTLPLLSFSLPAANLHQRLPRKGPRRSPYWTWMTVSFAPGQASHTEQAALFGAYEWGSPPHFSPPGLGCPFSFPVAALFTPFPGGGSDQPNHIFLRKFFQCWLLNIVEC